MRITGTCALLAVAPDLDFVPGILLGAPALHHQGVSHGLGFAVLASGCAALAFGVRRDTGRLWLLFLSAYGTHLALDLLGHDARPPLGIPLLWPLSDTAFLAPAALLPGIEHASRTQAGNAEWLASILGWANVRAIGLEVALLAPFAGFAEWRRQGGARRERGSV